MKAVKKLNYLFLRNRIYYFRFNFPLKTLGCDIRISLKTQNLVYALQRIEAFGPKITELKRLAIASKSLCLPNLKQQVDLVKEDMKKQLTFSEIDNVLAEAEKNSSSHMHMMNVLGDVSIADLPNETLEQLADVLMTEDHKQMQQKVSSYAANNESFQSGISLVAKYATLQVAGHHNIEPLTPQDKSGPGLRELATMLKYSENIQSEEDTALTNTIIIK
ncbi:MAG: hypothetical protein NWQ54_19810 [Paraglaciecola sp.]|nr:hypothetical protein [Paraglaciecola sp.]